MKQQVVQYKDLFSGQVFEAKNKLLRKISEHISVAKLNSFKTLQEKEAFLRRHAMVCECECNHPFFVDGVCVFRNCRHSVENHK